MSNSGRSMVKCDSCRKQLLEIRFSQTSIQKYKDSMARNQRYSRTPIKYPRCLDCNPGNRQEMKCTKCGLTKSLDDFSRAQRSRTDVAECKDCVQEREDRVPNHEDAVEEEIIMEEIQRGEIRSSYIPSNASRLPSNRNSDLSRSQTGTDRYETETNPGSDSWAYGNDAVSLAGSSYSTGTIASRRPQTGTDWDNYEGDNRARGPSNPASRGGFVKSGAVPKSQMQKAQEQLQREQNRQRFENEKLRSADSDEGSDDDEDEPY